MYTSYLQSRFITGNLHNLYRGLGLFRLFFLVQFERLVSLLPSMVYRSLHLTYLFRSLPCDPFDPSGLNPDLAE